MPPTIEALGIDKLSIPDRISLVQEIWDSIAITPQAVPLTDDQRQELDRRLRTHEADPSAVVSWDVIKADALARFQK
jgi:putative addiction module component (TIGR02574 family)